MRKAVAKGVVELRNHRDEVFFVRRSEIAAVVWDSEAPCFVEDCHESGCFKVFISSREWLYCAVNPVAPDDTREARIIADLKEKQNEYRRIRKASLQAAEKAKVLRETVGAKIAALMSKIDGERSLMKAADTVIDTLDGRQVIFKVRSSGLFDVVRVDVSEEYGLSRSEIIAEEVSGPELANLMEGWLSDARGLLGVGKKSKRVRVIE